MILVVDDDNDILKTLERILKHHGFRVESAHDGVEAYEKLKSPDCKCMLLDINMPKINGIELLLLMQTEEIEMPVIVMAGFDDFDENELLGFNNVVKFLHKPFETKDMLKQIKKYARQ